MTAMIRPCTDDDVATILAIVNDGATAYQGVVPADCLHEPYMGEAALRRELGQGVHFWGYEDEGQLQGVMGIQDVQDVALIRHAYVRTARRGQGIGERLLTHLKGLTARPVLIGTWAAASWAIRFYERRGFQLASPAEKDRLLATYWTIPARQAAVSVVLRERGRP